MYFTNKKQVSHGGGGAVVAGLPYWPNFLDSENLNFEIYCEWECKVVTSVQEREEGSERQDGEKIVRSS